MFLWLRVSVDLWLGVEFACWVSLVVYCLLCFGGYVVAGWLAIISGGLVVV